MSKYSACVMLIPTLTAVTSTASRRGTVYGSLLNFQDALAALGDAVSKPPYKAPPKGPILYIKPRNTWAGDGDTVVVPTGVEALSVGASLGLVIGATACAVAAGDALGFVAGYVVVNDLSVPHSSYYRPSMRFICRDGFCPIGKGVARASVGDPASLTLRVEIDGVEVLLRPLTDLVRPAAKLIADVTEFMTLHPGDVLMIGIPGGAPLARVGQRVTVSIDGVGRVENRLVDEEGA